MYAQARTSNATASITSFSISPPRPEQYVPILFGRRELPQRAEQHPLRANATSAVAGPLLAAHAKSRNGRGYFSIAPDGLYSGLLVTGRPLPHLFPPRRRSAVAVNISSLAPLPRAPPPRITC